MAFSLKSGNSKGSNISSLPFNTDTYIITDISTAVNNTHVTLKTNISTNIYTTLDNTLS